MEAPIDQNSYYNKLIDPGYIVFERSLPNRLWFDSLYNTFDNLLNDAGPEQFADLRSAALEWLQEGDNNGYFCGTPPAIRNRADTDGKRNKLYYQYCLEFINSKEFAQTWLSDKPETANFVNKIKEVEEICSNLFRKVLNDIALVEPSFLSRYDENRPLPIIIKLVRYNFDAGHFATDPHFDKSALSIIVDADDEHVSWRVGKGLNCQLSDMTAPFDYPTQRTENNHCILFAGLCLQAAGVNIQPAPHFVMPVTTKQHRHSLIAFLLVPNLPDTDKLDTQATYIHNIMRDIN